MTSLSLNERKPLNKGLGILSQDQWQICICFRVKNTHLGGIWWLVNCLYWLSALNGIHSGLQRLILVLQFHVPLYQSISLWGHPLEHGLIAVYNCCPAVMLLYCLHSTLQKWTLILRQSCLELSAGFHLKWNWAKIWGEQEPIPARTLLQVIFPNLTLLIPWCSRSFYMYLLCLCICWFGWHTDQPPHNTCKSKMRGTMLAISLKSLIPPVVDFVAPVLVPSLLPSHVAWLEWPHCDLSIHPCVCFPSPSQPASAALPGNSAISERLTW